MFNNIRKKSSIVKINGIFDGLLNLKNKNLL